MSLGPVLRRLKVPRRHPSSGLNLEVIACLEALVQPVPGGHCDSPRLASGRFRQTPKHTTTHRPSAQLASKPRDGHDRRRHQSPRLPSMSAASGPREAEAVLVRDAAWTAPLLWRSGFRNTLAGARRARGDRPLTTRIRIGHDAERRMGGAEFSVVSQHVLQLAIRSRCSAYDCEFVSARSGSAGAVRHGRIGRFSPPFRRPPCHRASFVA